MAATAGATEAATAAAETEAEDWPSKTTSLMLLMM